jgi:hypothetical protein
MSREYERVDMLLYSYYLPSNVVNFVIEWEQVYDSVRSTNMFACPRRLKASITGPYSRWMPATEV